LVVLSNNLRSSLGEIEGEGGLVGAQIVDVENKFLGKIFWAPPDDPANTWVNKTIPEYISRRY
jgi:hypothetical protein